MLAPRRFNLTRLLQGRSAWELPEEEPASPPDRQPDQTLLVDVDAPSPDSPNSFRQRYNQRGYPINPDSRALSRTSRRAQNDVLSTVGICVGVHEDGRPAAAPFTIAKASNFEAAKIDEVRNENEIGLIMSAASQGAFFFSIWWIAGLRNRIQVCLPLLICSLLPNAWTNAVARLSLRIPVFP